MSENYAIIDGERYPVKFGGYDSDTYEHRKGCLAHGMAPGPCQCGAIDRAKRIYLVEVPPLAELGKSEVQK